MARALSDASPSSAVGANSPLASGTISLDDIVKCVRSVPVAPEILPKLQAKLQNVDTDVADLAALIKLDAGLASSVLRVSNSAYYSRSQDVSSIEEAVTVIGYQETLRLVARCSYATVMKGTLESYGLPGEKLWSEAVLAAFAMEQLSHQAGIEPSEGYVAGLLHAVGMVAINDFLNRYGRGRNRAPSMKPAELVRWEIDTLGYHHGQVGAAMMRQWHIAPSVAIAVEQQFNATVRTDEPILNCLLPLAVSIAVAVERQPENVETVIEPEFDPSRSEKAGFEEEKLREVAADVRSDWAQTRKFLV